MQERPLTGVVFQRGIGYNRFATTPIEHLFFRRDVTPFYEEASMNRRSALLLLLMFTTLFTACATTRLSAVWKDPAYDGPPRKVLVYGMLKNAGNRRIIEDEFVRQLRSRKVEATPGYELFAGSDLVTKDVLEAKLKEGGFDTLLLTRPTGTKSETVSVAGTAYYPASYYGTYGGYYNTGYAAAYSPGRSYEQDYVFAETNLYNVATEKLFWTATSETWIGTYMENQIKEYVGLIVGQMRKQKVLP
jgi:hypothetical protein